VAEVDACQSRSSWELVFLVTSNLNIFYISSLGIASQAEQRRPYVVVIAFTRDMFPEMDFIPYARLSIVCTISCVRDAEHLSAEMNVDASQVNLNWIYLKLTLPTHQGNTQATIQWRAAKRMKRLGVFISG
jgi:hypothetical protein